MALNRGSLRTEVVQNHGNRTDITTRANTALDLAQLRIARAFTWLELEKLDEVTITIVTPDAAVDKTVAHGITDLRDIHSLVRQVSSETPRKLVRIPQKQWDQLIGKPDALTTGQDANFYSFWDDTIELFPVPNRTYKLQRRHTVWPADFASDAAFSDLTRKDDMIIALATSMIFEGLGMREDSGRWFVIYRDMLNDAKQEDRQRPDEAYLPRGYSEDDAVLRDPVRDPFVRRIRP